ncbi:hypothetical protein D0B54_00650 [Solimonas sp. K1W22B-7]|uniref:pilus assembly protein PilP n=1 Tax=Solimonas sp. K1W22B-7 TaxID=2303331 RepID=UPI000E334252|nr:pilus assembly protein PilP [Solimonas sp. K1W22B-7]AXQ27287.1 hypothetical protein D0B54_00650 [Solimonas sp. K1W22B-7]
MKTSKQNILRLLLLAAAVSVAGCGKGLSDLEAWVTEVKARKPPPIEPIPQMKQYEAFSYSANGRRDPFEAFAPARAFGPGLRPDLNRNKEPLEEFDLSGLRMVGTVDSKGTVYALIRAPDAVVHRVTLKNHIGENYGEIVSISEAEVGLVELVPDGFGGWVQRPASLTLTEQR